MALQVLTNEMAPANIESSLERQDFTYEDKLNLEWVEEFFEVEGEGLGTIIFTFC